MGQLTLYELAGLIRDTLSILAEDLWVTAEIARVTVHPASGHCYMELVEKREDTVIAQMKATMWARVYRPVQERFRTATGTEIRKGMKILMLGRVSYHEVYGLSFNVSDVDPAYTLGEMALRKKETLERLAREGLMARNRAVPLPVVLQRIAIISSSTAAGYGDFLDRLEKNAYGYVFVYRLFPAYLQGEKAQESILDALEECRAQADLYDAAVIVRGGGSDVDLNAFDSYAIARAIALFPLPVFTGIGHERDNPVASQVAHRSLITPSATAEFILLHNRSFEEELESRGSRLLSQATSFFTGQSGALDRSAALLGQSTEFRLDRARTRMVTALRNLPDRAEICLRLVGQALISGTISFRVAVSGALRIPSGTLAESAVRLRRAVPWTIGTSSESLSRHARSLPARLQPVFRLREERLANLGTRADLLSPANVLRRGYSITFAGGKPLRDASGVRAGERITTQLFKGRLVSRVEEPVEGEYREQK